MISQRQYIDSTAKQAVILIRGQARAIVNVLGIRNHYIDLVLKSDIRQARTDRLIPWLSDNITEKKYSHKIQSLTKTGQSGKDFQ